MIQGGPRGAAGRERIQSRSCIKLNINNSGLWSVRVSRGWSIYPPISIYPSATRCGCRDHNTPGSLRPWTRLHLISRIVLNHHGSQGSPRISRLSRGRYRWPAAFRARARTLKRSPGSNYWFSTHEYIIRRTLASANTLLSR